MQSFAGRIEVDLLVRQIAQNLPESVSRNKDVEALACINLRYLPNRPADRAFGRVSHGVVKPDARRSGPDLDVTLQRNSGILVVLAL